MISYKKSYKIYKDDVFCGYLLGSLHMHIDPLDYEQLVKHLTSITQEVTEIFIECNLPHHTMLSYGVERAVLESADSLGKGEALRYFETVDFQYAMLNSFVWFGDRIVSLPWHNYAVLEKHPKIWLWVSKLSQAFLRVYNTIYNIFTSGRHAWAVQRFQEEQHQILLKLVSAYKSGEVYELSKSDCDRYLIKPRNDNKVSLIDQNIKSGSTSLYVVGVAHLPGDRGIVELLKDRGYTLEPWEL